MTELATLEVEAGDTTIARLAGELDVSNTGYLGDRILESVSSSAGALVVDLRETTYLDSSAIKLIFDLAEKLSARRQRLHLLVEKGSFTEEVLETVNVSGVAPVHTELADALRGADSDERPPRED
jgi:anti-sigma B factor antagonist